MHFLRRAFCACLAALMVCAAAPAAAGAEQEEQPAAGPALKVAVVNMTEVVAASKQWRDAGEERLRLMEKMKRTVTKLRQQVQVLRNEHANLPPGTEERQQKEQEIARALEELRQTQRDFETRIAEHHNKAARKLFGKITDAVKAHAEKNEIDLVLKKRDPDLAAGRTAEESLLLATTEVLYAAPALDISDAVTERINAGYPGPMEPK